jgi:hypothetical protein
MSRRNASEKDRDLNRAERTADNWAAVRRMGRRYFVALYLILAAFLWLAGYSMGLTSACLPTLNKESNG